MRYLFVGERQSPLAYARGWTWESGRVCAGTLGEALRACGIDPAQQTFENAFLYDGSPSPALADTCGAALASGYRIVALGKRASRALRRLDTEHLVLVHPAARGRIRKRERYHAHVAEVLAA